MENKAEIKAKIKEMLKQIEDIKRQKKVFNKQMTELIKKNKVLDKYLLSLLKHIDDHFKLLNLLE